MPEEESLADIRSLSSPVPTPPDMIFYRPAPLHELYLVETYALLEKMSSDELIFLHLLPFLESKEDARMAEVKLTLVDYALDSGLHPLDSLKARFRKLDLIPKASTPSIKGLEFRCLADTIDPDSSLAAIFFKDEDIFPEPKFFKRHSIMLSACGIVRQMTPHMLLERARSFARSPNRDLTEIRSKVEQTFALTIPGGIDLPTAALREFRNLKWLPVSKFSSNELQLMSPINCRAADEKNLVDLVLGVFHVNVTQEWKQLLGWDQRIDKKVLSQQLDKALAKRMGHHVDSVLTELSKFDDYSFLRQVSCIRSTRGEYLLPERLLLPKSLLSRYPLAPYMDEVEPSFAQRHPRLLTALGIREDLTYADVLSIQGRILETTQSNQLSDENLKVFLTLLEVAIRLEHSNNLSALMIPDTERKLRPRTDIVHGERKVTGEIATFNFVHPQISPYLVQHLDLEKSFARATRLGIDFEDEDDDEYTPHEKLTTIISDTLDRYPINSTFGEFLANANDCGATRISWILDECADGPHASSTLLTEELKDFQGSALFVHNNQVFEEKDFRGFKEIGHGGKIDPQQNLLPRNKHWKRKAGVRVPLATARRLFPDQLRPFHGLEGFSMELDCYNGTLFRLPLRNTEQTLLKGTSAKIDAKTTRILLEEYYSDAQISLLFLSNVNEIVFRVRDQADGAAVWRVQAQRASGPFKEVFENVSIESVHESGRSHRTTWRVGRQTIDEAPEGIQKPGQGADKVTECGLAACVEKNGLPHVPLGMEQRVFCTLPTSSSSGLPVSVHASFAITGDRKSIPFEDSERETPVKKWNRWLLKECIPEFYIEFLKDGAPRLGQKCFDFWPSLVMSTIDRSIGGLVYKAFWALLARPEYESYQLYPLVDSLEPAQGSTPLKTRARGNARKVYKVASLKSAQFDVLHRTVSRKLRPLFSRLCPNLVQPSATIWRCMADAKIDQQATALVPAYLGILFKDPANCSILEDYVRSLRDESERDEVAEMLLRIVIPDASIPSKHSIDSIHGCRIVPKLDHTLGTIRFRKEKSNPFPHRDLLFLSTDREVELFRNADLMIRPNLFRKVDGKITSSVGLSAGVKALRNPLRDLLIELSNIREVGIGDVHRFLDHVDPSSALVSPGAPDWITQFWSYLNPRLTTFLSEEGLELSSAPTSDLMGRLKLADTRIYRYDDNGSWVYITPSQFEAGPYVLLPPEEKQIELCKELPEVKLLDPHCVPLQLRHRESTLKDRGAFSRLLRALGRITVQPDGSRTKDLSLKQQMKAGSYKLLRDLVAVFVNNDDDATEYKKILRSMKIWPQYHPSVSTAAITCIAADGALLCSTQAMLVPWIQNSDRFIDPSVVAGYPKTLKMLGCTVMKVATAWEEYVRPGLPVQFASDQLWRYLQCVQCLEHHGYNSTSVMAPNGYGWLCSPSMLFDHDDTMFKAAFRKSEESHFLHPDFRSKRKYWISLGLRTKSSIRSADFVECVSMMGQRLAGKPSQGAEDVQDAGEVTAYLRHLHPDTQSWPGSAWTAIAQAKIYRATRNISSQPSYRRAQMLYVASKHELCSITSAAPTNHLRILWSQRPLLADPPASAIYPKLLDGGRPSIPLVYNHLQFLVSIRNDIDGADVSEYLEDIRATYSYMQDHRQESVAIPAIREAKIWMNLHSTDLSSISAAHFENALRSVKSLCFNAPLDTHAMERAKNFLVPYESLLRALGCHTMVRPDRPAMAPRNKQQRPMDSILTAIRAMREEGQLTDVIFEVEGEQVPANRNFMAAASGLWRTRFLGPWGRDPGAQPVIDVGADPEMKLKTVRYMVDFAYTGEVQWPWLRNKEDVREVADVLDDLLDLLKGADEWDMATLHDLTERQLLNQSDDFVRPDNVEDVRDLATEANGQRFARHCEAFRKANEKFVEDCKAMKVE
ncbi:MAG: hypothetical protein LQ345_004942 [Seirophora villosa]|nr:MAG: hypothetical protein LQ345_004942 [Seirophora villosa]